MKRLDVESTDDYQAAEETIKYLTIVRAYYSTGTGFDELDTGNIRIREIFRFMSDNGFPKRGFVDENTVKEIIKGIDEEINKINQNLKQARLAEIQDRELNSLLIIPSWSAVLGHKTMGFYLNRPVTELKRDTIIMLSHDIIQVQDKLGTELALLTGPAIFFTEFSLDRGSYITNTREINMVLIPLEMLEKLLDAPPIFTSDIDATLNELISIIPFSLIEEAYSVQAILRGVISRNLFHPNKAALDTFLDICKDPESYNPKNGFKIMSAHSEYFNRLLLTQSPLNTKGDEYMNVSSAGIASILPHGQSLLDEIIPDKKEQSDMLLQFKDIKNEFDKVGKDLLSNWLP